MKLFNGVLGTGTTGNVFLSAAVVLLFLGCGMSLASVLFFSIYNRMKKQPVEVSRGGQILGWLYLIVFLFTGWIIYGR